MYIKWTRFELKHSLDKKNLSTDDIFDFVKRINNCHAGKCIIIRKNKNGYPTFPIHQLSILETESMKAGYVLKQL